MILSRHAEGSFHHMEGVLEMGHGCKVEVAVELYIGFCFEAFDQHVSVARDWEAFFFGQKPENFICKLIEYKHSWL